jgi:ribosomal protein S18 acetylase RimI-like enzyme
MGEGQIVVRRPLPEEFPAVHRLVHIVTQETYGHLWTVTPRLPDFDCSLAWIAIAGPDIAGVVLTDDAWVNELWVAAAQREKGIGSRLLAKGEAEIAARGYDWASLYVLESNARARGFYARHGWQAVRTSPHESLPALLIEMVKPVSYLRHQRR